MDQDDVEDPGAGRNVEGLGQLRRRRFSGLSMNFTGMDTAALGDFLGNGSKKPFSKKLDKKGLMMYGQMTAESWIYIGTQGILQGTYETFASLADRHFNGSLAGRISLSEGLGGIGGAQPLAVTMNGGVASPYRQTEAMYDSAPFDGDLS